ncbi:MAG: o-succinylbenzoate--CoA ligase [candidate division Zixibacteria bacterium]|nr:o-succinylbenzoate--CoA ligase [candidate division Zixibacteria bacterium]
MTNRIPCPVVEAARLFCGHTALVDPARAQSFDSFDRQTSAVAHLLTDHGLREGDRLALVMENSAAMVLAIAACVRLGVVFCPLNTRWPMAMHVDAIESIGAKAVISERDLKHGLIIRIEDVQTAARDSHDEPVVDPPLRSPDAPAGIVFTSGSAAEPKAVLHTLGNYHFNALGSNRNIRFGPGDRWLLSLPLYHVGGLGILFRALAGGGAVVVAARDEHTLEAIRRYRVTHLSLVTTQLRRLLSAGEDLKTLSRQIKALLVGGSTVPDVLIHRACDYGLPVYKSYGLTEMASQVTTTSPQDLPARLATSGCPLEYREIQINEQREILVRGQTLFAGYVKKDEITRPVDDDGWFATGDLGRFDREGYLTVFGRRDNMFVSGGENVMPEMIERALCSLDGVEDALVVPIEDAEYGHRPVAFVKTPAGTLLQAEDMRRSLTPLIPRYAMPVRYLPWPESIAGTGLKPLRSEFARLLSTGDSPKS